MPELPRIRIRHQLLCQGGRVYTYLTEPPGPGLFRVSLNVLAVCSAVLCAVLANSALAAKGLFRYS